MNKISPQQRKLKTMGWLRAAVLGANDGIVSTASLIIGVAVANTAHGNILLTGVAGMVAGGMSMAAGEYISVYSQSDTEKAAVTEEKRELRNNPENELRELANIYVDRGLSVDLAIKVAEQLMARDALAAHAHDELGISELSTPKPLQAAIASAASFALGASIPLLVVLFNPDHMLIWLVVLISLLSLSILGALAAKVGGSRILPSVLRVTFWSSLAMAITALIGYILGTPV